jgi:hypothetical protein
MRPVSIPQRSDDGRNGVKAERSKKQWSETMQHRQGTRGEGREIRFVRTHKVFRLFEAARQLVPADRGSERLLQIGAGLPSFDQRRPQLGQQTYLVVDRPGIADRCPSAHKISICPSGPFSRCSRALVGLRGMSLIRQQLICRRKGRRPAALSDPVRRPVSRGASVGVGQREGLEFRRRRPRCRIPMHP